MIMCLAILVNKRYNNVEYSLTFPRSSFIHNLHRYFISRFYRAVFELLHIEGSSLETILIRHLATLGPYQSYRAIPGSPDMMDLFRRMGKKVIYVTNNAIYPTETNVAKLTRLGYKAEKVSIKEISDDTYVYSGFE